jgi:hypothetical protein
MVRIEAIFAICMDRESLLFLTQYVKKGGLAVSSFFFPREISDESLGLFRIVNREKLIFVPTPVCF